MEKQTQPTQPVQPTITEQPAAPPPSKTNIWMIVSLILITAIVVGVIVYFWIQGQQKTELLPGKITEAVSPEVTVTETLPTSPSKISSTPVVKPELTSLDNNWNKYTNSLLGFSLKVPKQMLDPAGNCFYNNTDTDKSYRPKEAIVPVKIFPADAKVYIASEYNYILTGETTENFRTTYTGCEKTPVTIARIADRENYHSPDWTIEVKTINNDVQLSQFIKNRYGIGCSIGEKKAFAQEGVFNIEILGDGLDLSETKCPLNYATKVLYYPVKQKVVAWDIGQACAFNYPTLDNCLDLEMVDSFRFE